jgi:ureidoglycolate lyase
VSATPRALVAESLTAGAFAEFGDVVEACGRSGLINSGTARQFADLTDIDVAGEGGRPCVSIYRATPYPLPLPIRMLERHPLGSQLFMPLSDERFLVVVAPAAAVPDRAAVRAFVTDGHQGVNYRRGTWHHPLIALAGTGEYLVIDRAGPGSNCDEFQFGDAALELQRPG